MEFNDNPDSIQPSIDVERAERLMHFLTGLMDGMTREQIILMRDSFRAEVEQAQGSTAIFPAIFEIIEGHLALRDMNP
jgi:hypothetical protein